MGATVVGGGGGGVVVAGGGASVVAGAEVEVRELAFGERRKRGGEAGTGDRRQDHGHAELAAFVSRKARRATANLEPCRLFDVFEVAGLDARGAGGNLETGEGAADIVVDAIATCRFGVVLAAPVRRAVAAGGVLDLQPRRAPGVDPRGAGARAAQNVILMASADLFAGP